MKLETLEKANELKGAIEFREKMLDVLKNKKYPSLTYHNEVNFDFKYNGFKYSPEYILDDEMVKSLITIISEQKEKLEKELE